MKRIKKQRLCVILGHPFVIAGERVVLHKYNGQATIFLESAIIPKLTLTVKSSPIPVTLPQFVDVVDSKDTKTAGLVSVMKGGRQITDPRTFFEGSGDIFYPDEHGVIKGRPLWMRGGSLYDNLKIIVDAYYEQENTNG